MRTIGQHLLHWLWAGLQWLGGRVGNLLGLTFWLLVQTLELLLWAASELKARVDSGFDSLKKVIKQNKNQLLLSPLQGVLRLFWQAIVQAFWLLVQVIELIAWYLEIFQKASHHNSGDKATGNRQQGIDKRYFLKK